MTVATYETSPIKRKRRTKADISRLCQSLYNIAWEIEPATVRQLFYQATVQQILPKTEASYKLVCRMLTIMRRAGDLPYDWIADNTRWQRKPRTYSSLSQMLETTKRTYRRALWDDQDVYVEIWCEKEALAGVLYEVTAEWDVPLMVTKGYPSVSFLHSAAEAIASQDTPTHIYYFGDWDPSGTDIDRFVEQELRRYAPDSDIAFSREAVLPWQITQMELPTRPTKKTDSRSKNFKGDSVELDAIRPDLLRQMCRDCIERHIDTEQLERTRRVEEAERETLAMFAGEIGDDD
jgi:hypothetical protein